MSVINFTCSPNRREEVKTKCWDIVRKHYANTVFPNTNVRYENEDTEVYTKRLNDLMKSELCKANETENGLSFKFDSTEDAGFSIAIGVYDTNMGYSDNGLTFLKNMFEAIIKEMPDISFEAECECCDNWVSEEYTLVYDGHALAGNAEWLEYEE